MSIAPDHDTISTCPGAIDGIASAYVPFPSPVPTSVTGTPCDPR